MEKTGTKVFNIFSLICFILSIVMAVFGIMFVGILYFFILFNPGGYSDTILLVGLVFTIVPLLIAVFQGIYLSRKNVKRKKGRAIPSIILSCSIFTFALVPLLINCIGNYIITPQPGEYIASHHNKHTGFWRGGPIAIYINYSEEDNEVDTVEESFIYQELCTANYIVDDSGLSKLNRNESYLYITFHGDSGEVRYYQDGYVLLNKDPGSISTPWHAYKTDDGLYKDIDNFYRYSDAPDYSYYNCIHFY